MNEAEVVCADCGVVVRDQKVHERFHSILSGHAWSLAVLKTAHIASHVHNRYDVPERLSRRKFDSWSAEAFAEVVKETGALNRTTRIHDGIVHEMADRGVGTMCGIELPEPWTYTDDPVNCEGCLGKPSRSRQGPEEKDERG